MWFLGKKGGNSPGPEIWSFTAQSGDSCTAPEKCHLMCQLDQTSLLHFVTWFGDSLRKSLPGVIVQICFTGDSF